MFSSKFYGVNLVYLPVLRIPTPRCFLEAPGIIDDFEPILLWSSVSIIYDEATPNLLEAVAMVWFEARRWPDGWQVIWTRGFWRVVTLEWLGGRIGCSCSFFVFFERLELIVHRSSDTNRLTILVLRASFWKYYFNGLCTYSKPVAV